MLLFLMASGLTVIFSMLGVLNFAHASFYMLGAFFGFQISRWFGFWPALLIAPLLAGAFGAGVERFGLRRVRRNGRVADVLFPVGTALAAVAGVIAGPALVTQANMAGLLGPILFVVVVVGGLGSLPGAFVASLLIGLVQTFAVSMNGSLSGAFGPLSPDYASTWLADIWSVTIAQIAPIIPDVLLVLILIFRPMVLLGTRET